MERNFDPSVPDEERGILGEMVGGVQHGFDRATMGIKQLLPKSIQNLGDKAGAALGMAPMDQERLDRGKRFIDKTSAASNVGQLGFDVGVGLMGAGATKLGPLADLSTQALIGATTTPGDMGERAGGAIAGTVGAAGGRLLTRALGGPLKPAITPEANIMMENGIPLTPGEMVSGQHAGGLARAMKSLEDKSTSIPIIGDIVQAAKRRSSREYNKVEINAALAPLNAKISLAGKDALARANEIVDNTYEAIKPEIIVQPSIARPTIAKALANIHKNHELFDAGHAQKLNRILAIKIEPLIAGNKAIDGEVAKEIDARLGALAREQTGGNKPLATAIYDIQEAWRNSMVGLTKHSTKQLADANTAFKNLRALNAAGEKNAEGVFSPKNLIDASKQVKGGKQELAQVARQVMPDTVPDSGTAGRSALGLAAKALITGTAAQTVGGLPAVLGATAATGAAYSRPGLSYLAKGLEPATKAALDKMPAAVRTKILQLAPDEMEHAIRLWSTQGMRGMGNQLLEQ